ncbi:unnamed protein product [Linum tenue]|uniref:Peroxidase n=1 Tax=Linum tenue TaxID=586396 RepID=A0AAV0QUP8_9ROSI|nr:unnamed protein product [Linum tenue]
MSSSSSTSTIPKVAATLLLTTLALLVTTPPQSQAAARLSTDFYSKNCPRALTAIRAVVRGAVTNDRRIAGSLIRLQFHDCFVRGCDASVLLDKTATTGTEKDAAPNRRFTKTFRVIEDAKSQVERMCPGVVSCADIVAVAARDASAAVEGPSWGVELGRRDSDDLKTLISRFRKKGLNSREMVALSGAHTLGTAQCFTFRERVYGNETVAKDVIDPNFARKKRRMCPASGGDRLVQPLDPMTPTSFDNNYFKALMLRKGLLASDQVLFSGGSTDGIVREYSRNGGKFKGDFAAAMVKMGRIGVLTGSKGQIRRTCSKAN